jgi:hypothetical protein
MRDPLLHELLALVDAIREGRARERKLAERELVKLLHRKTNAKQKPGSSKSSRETIQPRA